MIEEIKELAKKYYINFPTGELLNLLDKYKNQTYELPRHNNNSMPFIINDKYKNAWEELMNLYRVTYKDTMSKNDYAVLHTLEEIQKKHNIGIEVK